MSDFTQILSDLKKKVYHPVYFLMGEETYFIDAISDYIENNVLNETEREFDQTVIYGRDTDLGTILGTAKRFPMMSSYQVVIVKEAQNIREFGAKEKTDKDDKPPFQAYIENPQKSTILVICYKYKSLDKRTSLAKSIAKHAVLFESKKLYENQVPDWIIGYLKNKGHAISPKAAVLLTEYLGNDLSKIANELDKLMINIPKGAEVTEQHIQDNIGISKDYNIFELQTALGKRDVLKANRIIKYFASNPKDNPLVVTLSSLYNYFSKLLIYHFTPDKSKSGIASALGVHPFFVGDYEKAAKNFPPQKLRAIVAYLRDYDLKSKGIDSGSVPEGELLKELVFKILH